MDALGSGISRVIQVRSDIPSKFGWPRAVKEPVTSTTTLLSAALVPGCDEGRYGNRRRPLGADLNAYPVAQTTDRALADEACLGRRGTRQQCGDREC